MLRLRTFGGCAVEVDGRRLEALSGQRKALALLAMLAASGELGVSRDRAAASLWEESDEERARTSLRQLIHTLRSRLRAPNLLMPSAELRLDPSVIGSDVGEFREALARGDDAEAVSHYAGPFLDGFHLRGAEGFERWLDDERRVLASEFARCVERLAETATAKGDHRAAVGRWRQLAHADPLSARAAVGLIKALDLAGERPEAIQHARVYDALVREELGIEPDPAVAALAHRLRSVPPAPEASIAREPEATVTARTDPAPAPHAQEAHDASPRVRRALVAAATLAIVALGALALWRSVGTRAAAATAADADTVRSAIVVLPFANSSGDASDGHLAAGLTDEVTHALAALPGLRVTGRTSAFAIAARQLDVRSIGDTLGVTSVLEGSWRRKGNQLRVGARLVRTSDGAIVWSESYERTVTDVLMTQAEIAAQIVQGVRRQLIGARSAGVDTPASRTDSATYDRYLRGRYVFHSRTTRDDVLQAVALFEEATARDPSFAPAHAGLSDAYARLAVFGYGPARELYDSAKVSAHRALALDSTLAEAHAALAHALTVADFEWGAAEQAFRRAIELDPNYTFARVPFAIHLSSQGRFEEAIEQLQIAQALDPLALPPGTVLGRVYVMAGRPDEAIRTLQRVLELNPNADLAHQQLGHAHLLRGDSAQALAALRRAAALSGPRDSAQLAYALAVSGAREEAERVVRTLRDGAERRGLSYHLAMAYAGLGDHDTALTLLERAYAERGSFVVGLRVDRAFAPLHDDRRWRELVRRMEARAQP